MRAPITLVHPPVWWSAKLYRANYAGVKGMTFVLANNSLHFVMLDQPQQFNAALDAFLAQ